VVLTNTTPKPSIRVSSPMSDIPDELPRHDGPRCSYACSSVSPPRVSDPTAYDANPNSQWARESYQVELVAGVILGCSCDEDGLCKHIEHVIESDWRGCIEYLPIGDAEHVRELKAFSREQRQKLYEESIAAQ
jgi:hypothetical protein